MNEEYWINKFSEDVDALLQERRLTTHDNLPDFYQGMLDVAKQLAAIDFSLAAACQQTLKRSLLIKLKSNTSRRWFTQLADWADWIHKLNGIGICSRYKWRKFAFVSLLILSLGFMIALASPERLQAATRTLLDIIKRIKLGYYVEVLQLRPEPSWIISDEPDRACGIIGNGMTSTFEHAQQSTNFVLQKPAYLPAGFTLAEVRLANEDVSLIYNGPVNNLVIRQLKVGDIGYRRGSESKASSGIWIWATFVTDSSITEIHIGRSRGAWAGPDTLIWECDDVVYLIYAPGLSLEEIIKIAESMQ